MISFYTRWRVLKASLISYLSIAFIQDKHSLLADNHYVIFLRYQVFVHDHLLSLLAQITDPIWFKPLYLPVTLGCSIL